MTRQPWPEFGFPGCTDAEANAHRRWCNLHECFLEWSEYRRHVVQGIRQRGARFGIELRPEDADPREWRAFIKYRGRRVKQGLPFPSFADYLRDVCEGPRMKTGEPGIGKEIGDAIRRKLAEKGIRVAA